MWGIKMLKFIITILSIVALVLWLGVIYILGYNFFLEAVTAKTYTPLAIWTCIIAIVMTIGIWNVYLGLVDKTITTFKRIS